MHHSALTLEMKQPAGMLLLGVLLHLGRCCCAAIATFGGIASQRGVTEQDKCIPAPCDVTVGACHPWLERQLVPVS